MKLKFNFPPVPFVLKKLENSVLFILCHKVFDKIYKDLLYIFVLTSLHKQLVRFVFYQQCQIIELISLHHRLLVVAFV